jgi:hypothetical protein
MCVSDRRFAIVWRSGSVAFEIGPERPHIDWVMGVPPLLAQALFPSAAPLSQAARLTRLRRLAWLIDAAFRVPGTRFRFGLNSLIGLTPAAGDALLAAVSLYIVWEARALGVPRPKLMKMLANVGVETLAGTVPIVGDLFDMTFKANLRNLAIIEDQFGVKLRR